jgi:hypothetical protein
LLAAATAVPATCVAVASVLPDHRERERERERERTSHIDDPIACEIR